MSDLISRKWLRTAIIKMFGDSDIASSIDAIIDNAPTVENITVFCETADEETLEDIKKELQKVLDKLKERNDE